MNRYEVKSDTVTIGYVQETFVTGDEVSRQWVPVDMDGRQLPGGPYYDRPNAEEVVRQHWDDLLAMVFGLDN